jgi:Abnormal spindle-like microcephaly-assoc'd, ASPM-SPD-2-Hydin
MSVISRASGVAAACVLAAACGSNSPSAPSSSSATTNPTPTPTRIIRLGGSLDFGQVTVGNTADRTLSISNDGNSTLTITSISGPCASSLTSSFTSGTIGAGATQNATLRFAPTSVVSCSGVITVNGDQTSGTNTLAMSASSVAAVRSMTGTWTGSWASYTFTMVLTQTGTIVTGTYTDRDGSGYTDPAAPGSFVDPRVILRIKQGGFNDFTFDGNMDSTGRHVTGVVNAAGGTFTATMDKQ